jgi:dTDP-4-dehydrorhamnose 3,5-epimerase
MLLLRSKRYTTYEKFNSVKVTKTPFEGLLIIEPRIFIDERGHFFEAYNGKTFQKEGININFVQDNQSKSKRGVLRGLHFQKPPFAQTKLVRVLGGLIQDVVVDLRREQPTFGKSFSIELSSENNLQFLIPKGFAHGFLVLSESAEVLYKCDEYYAKESEEGIIFNDPAAVIKWELPANELVLSDKDMKLTSLNQLASLF